MKKHIPLLMTIFMVTVLASLGFWQLQRLQWKTTMLIGIDYKSTRYRTDLPAEIETPRFWDYRRVTLKGTYLHDQEFLLKPRTQEGVVGFDVITPLKRNDGTTVFVDRGFATDKTLRDFERPKGRVTVQGMARWPRKGFFTPENDPKSKAWYWLDTEGMAEAAHLKNALPVVVYTDETIQPIPNNHKAYAMFWFGMAFIFLLGYGLYAYKEKRR